MIENMDFLKNSGLNDCEIGILADSWLKFKKINKFKDIIFIYFNDTVIVNSELRELEKIAISLNRYMSAILFSAYNKQISVQLFKN
jgi:hypothetical protein